MAILISSIVWYTSTNTPKSTPTPTPKPSPTPYVPPANVTEDITVIPSYDLPNATPVTPDYLSINGTVTNNSPNIAYNVGLEASAGGYIGDREIAVIDVTVPIASGTYDTYTTYNLSTLAPYQSVSIVIEVYTNGTPTLLGSSAILVWSNMP